MKNVEVKFQTGLVLKGLQNAASRGLRQIGLDLADEINLNITINNQVDTGAMRASVFVDATGTVGQTRGQSIGEATWRASQPGVKSGETFDFGEKIETDITWRPQGKLEAKVALSAEYAKWQEKRIKFLAPAMDTVRSRQELIMSRELKKYLDK